MESKIVRKITPKQLLAGNVKRFVPEKDAKGEPTSEVKPLYRIYGQANDVRKGESTYGPWVSLVGRFEGVRLVDDPEGMGDATGEIFTAPECFLPEPVNTILTQTLEETRLVKDDAGKIVMETVYDTVTTTDAKGVTSSSKVARQVEKRERVTDSVEFGFEIGIKGSKASVGYEYVVQTIIKAESGDPLAHLREKMLALPAPASQPQLAAGKRK